MGNIAVAVQDAYDTATPCEQHSTPQQYPVRDAYDTAASGRRPSPACHSSSSTSPSASGSLRRALASKRAAAAPSAVWESADMVRRRHLPRSSPRRCRSSGRMCVRHRRSCRCRQGKRSVQVWSGSGLRTQYWSVRAAFADEVNEASLGPLGRSKGRAGVSSTAGTAVLGVSHAPCPSL